MSGAGSGIGRAAALLLAEEGARVACTDLDLQAVEALAEEIRALGGEALARALDVTRETDWVASMREVRERWGRLDVLVASAGISFAAPLCETTLADWRRVHEVNLDGAFLATREAARVMREQEGGGSVVLVGSASGVRAAAGAAAYSSSKGALRVFARAAARELAPLGVRVNTVVPAGVETPMWTGMPFFQELVGTLGSEAAAWQALARDTPLGRFARAEEVARAILFLATPDASYVTGSDLVVDGGYTA